MADMHTIMAVDNNGNEITVFDLRNWISRPELNKNRLSEFIFQRLYGRYIRPFEYDDANFKSKYKNGFTIMANCCLLIETYASFLEDVFTNTKGKSEKCFGWFFLTEKMFAEFSNEGLELADYLSNKPIKNKGTPRDFYRNVRCGILHNGETRNGWKIVRNGNLYNTKTKRINAVSFLKEMKNFTGVRLRTE